MLLQYRDVYYRSSPLTSTSKRPTPQGSIVTRPAISLPTQESKKMMLRAADLRARGAEERSGIRIARLAAANPCRLNCLRG